jgi:hypothetical protein
MLWIPLEKFKDSRPGRRKSLLQDYAGGKLRLADFPLAAGNEIKKQNLDVSGVRVPEYEINPND